MLRMDGIEFCVTMPQYPAYYCTSSVTNRVFDALNVGAVDFVANRYEKWKKL